MYQIEFSALLAASLESSTSTATVLSSRRPIFPAYCSPGRKGLSTGIVDADADVDVDADGLSSDDEAEHAVSTVGRLGFDLLSWVTGSSIGAPLLHTGIHGGCTMVFVRFFGEVLEVVVVEKELARVRSLEGDSERVDDDEDDDELWSAVCPGVAGEVPKRHK